MKYHKYKRSCQPYGLVCKYQTTKGHVCLPGIWKVSLLCGFAILKKIKDDISCFQIYDKFESVVFLWHISVTVSAELKNVTVSTLYDT
jgi:hypothetical protein